MTALPGPRRLRGRGPHPIDGLLTAAEMFGFRVPQLHSRDARAEPCRPDSYPATCHSQAWSSASAVLILRSWLGLELDVPSCVVRSPAVTGLRIVGHPVSFDSATLTGLPGDLMLV